MTVLAHSTCDECGRACYERGGVLRIEAARMLDGSEPGEVFLQSVADGHEPLRAMMKDLLGRRRSVDDLADVQVRFEEMARTGTLSIPTQLRELRDGIWEIKTPRLRLAFYCNNSHPSLPAIRVTNGFWKQQNRAEQRNIRYATKVREEDLDG